MSEIVRAIKKDIYHLTCEVERLEWLNRLANEKIARLESIILANSELRRRGLDTIGEDDGNS